MGKVARPRVVTKDALDTQGLPDHVQVALEEIASAAREGVLALLVACGLAVVGEIMAADVARICGPRGKHDPGREAYRHGAERRLVPLGGALVEKRAHADLPGEIVERLVRDTEVDAEAPIG